MSGDLERLKKAITRLRLGRSGDRTKPHKPVMLLVVLDLFESGAVEGNRIFYDQDLVERFTEYFTAIAERGDWCQPAPPFFHLRSSTFWKHKPISGREEAYSRLHTSGGGSRRILENIEYAYLEEGAFALFSDPLARQDLRRLILEAFFTSQQQAKLAKVMEENLSISRYESTLMDGMVRVEEGQLVEAIRGIAFRRVVLRGYDYQCAICGLRIVLPETPSPIEAAHLVPWNESHDDSPTNGMALCKLHHWALDAGLMAPTVDYHWQVSPLLDARRNSEHELTRFEGMPILLPRKKSLYPKTDAIRYRLARLRRR